MERWTPAFDRLFDRTHELSGGEPFCRPMAWLHICHNAQWEDGVRFINGEPITLKRGELCASLRWFADRWGWSIKRVRNFVEYLHDRKKLGTVRGTAQGTVYRVVSYGRYRPLGQAKGHDRGTIGAGNIEVIEGTSTHAREGVPLGTPPSPRPTAQEERRLESKRKSEAMARQKRAGWEDIEREAEENQAREEVIWSWLNNQSEECRTEIQHQAMHFARIMGWSSDPHPNLIRGYVLHAAEIAMQTGEPPKLQVLA